MKSKAKTDQRDPGRIQRPVSPLVALNLLREKEWTMGNGQCRECCGRAPEKEWLSDTVGHRKGCKVATALESLGGKVVWEHFNHSKRRQAHRKWWNEMWERANY